MMPPSSLLSMPVILLAILSPLAAAPSPGNASVPHLRTLPQQRSLPNARPLSVNRMRIFLRATARRRDVGHGVLVVTAFFYVPNKYQPGTYGEWIENSARFMAPYVVYGDRGGHDLAQRGRKGLPTVFVPMRSVLETETAARVREAVTDACRGDEDPTLVTDIMSNLHALELIWMAKTEFVFDTMKNTPAKAEDPVNGVDWFSWNDLGLNLWRKKPPHAAPWPAPGVLETLPTDRVLVTLHAACPCGEDGESMPDNFTQSCGGGTWGE
jgi:hypothetical protein